MELSPGTLKKWMDHELKGLNEGLVVKRKTLETLLREDEPSCHSRDGRVHRFDRGALERLARVVPRSRHGELKLPMNVRVDLGVKDQCCMDDELAANALRELEGFGRAYGFRDGRMWLPLSLAAELWGKYRGLLQLVFLA